MGRSLLGALAAVVNYVYLRNPFADGINDWPDSRLSKNPKSRLHRGFKILQMNFFYQYEPKSISCRRLETKRHSDRNGDFGFRRKAQVRSNTLFIFIKSVPCKGDTTRGKRKLKQGQKTAFPFPLMVSPLHTSSLNPYSLPFFIPLHFACRRRPNTVHLFALFSIAMFSDLASLRSFIWSSFVYLRAIL